MRRSKKTLIKPIYIDVDLRHVCTAVCWTVRTDDVYNKLARNDVKKTWLKVSLQDQKPSFLMDIKDPLLSTTWQRATKHLLYSTIKHASTYYKRVMNNGVSHSHILIQPSQHS